MPTVPPYISTLQPTRSRHTMIIGQGGSGKSNLCNQLVQHDIEAGAGLFHVDLDGADTNAILRLVPERRIKDVVLLDLSDSDYPVAINPFVGTGTDYDATVADMFVDAFKSIWSYEDAATPDMDRTIYNAARAILDYKDGTILDMYAILVSAEARARISAQIKDAIVRNYWREVFPALDQRQQEAVTKSTVNKLERFVSDVRVRNVLGQSKPLFSFSSAINERKIILLKIPQAVFGLSKAKTVSGLLLAEFNSAAQQRQLPIPFHLYLPDTQYLIGETVAQMLATLGKKSISITLSIQYLHQLKKLREAILGNVGNWVMFRVGLTDALYLEELFEWDNTRKFLYELEQYEARIATPNTLPKAENINPVNYFGRNYSKDIVKHCRHFYARPREEVQLSHEPMGGKHESQYLA